MIPLACSRQGAGRNSYISYQDKLMKDLLRTLALAIGAGSPKAAPIRSSDQWWSYVASYDAGPGSIRVDLALRNRAPLAEYPYLVVTGTTYTSEQRQGFPEASDLDRLNALQERIVSAITTQSPCLYAGTFTHNFEQLHYIYVESPAGVSQALSGVYLECCPSCKIYTSIKQDQPWSTYLDFLYPNKATIDHYGLKL